MEKRSLNAGLLFNLKTRCWPKCNWIGFIKYPSLNCSKVWQRKVSTKTKVNEKNAKTSLTGYWEAMKIPGISLDQPWHFRFAIVQLLDQKYE